VIGQTVRYTLWVIAAVTIFIVVSLFAPSDTASSLSILKVLGCIVAVVLSLVILIVIASAIREWLWAREPRSANKESFAWLEKAGGAVRPLFRWTNLFAIIALYQWLRLK